MSGHVDARLQALQQPELSLITLPRRADCPNELVTALSMFAEDTGMAAAVASATWLREKAFEQHGSARTYVWVGDGKLHGFFAVSVGVARLQDEDKADMEVGPYPVPAVLLAQAARAVDGTLPPGEIFRAVLGVAEGLRRHVAIAALLLDPFDEATSQMWQSRGFRPVRDPPRTGRPSRLWRPLTS